MELHSMRTCRPACPGASARHRACANLGSLAAQQRCYRTSLVLRSASTVELLPADSATQASPPAADAEPSTSDAEAPAQFNWYKQWYPVRIVQELDPSVPHPVMLLGLRLVLWKEGNTWRCLRDMCPHRLAPLSEGRIEPTTGNLYCNYHAWQFNGAGQCTSIPQLAPGATINQKASCVASYPTKEAEGLLWVWADAGPGAEEEAAAAPWKGVAPELDQYGPAACVSNRGWYFRELPVSWLAVRENVFNDPAHDPVLHHGATPFMNRASARFLPARRTSMDPAGYSISVGPSEAPFYTDTITLPCSARRQPYSSQWPSMMGYVVPSAPGRTLYFTTMLRQGAPPQQKALGWKQRLQQLLRPAWVEHVKAHGIVDADVAMAAGLSANRVETSAKPHLPSQADAGPASLLLWLEKYGGGGPPTSTLQDALGGASPDVPRQQLLDRFHSHTHHCSSCRSAWDTATKVQDAGRLLCAALAAAALAVLVGCGKPLAAAGLGVLAGLSMAAAAAATRLRQALLFVDYDKNHPSKK